NQRLRYWPERPSWHPVRLLLHGSNLNPRPRAGPKLRVCTPGTDPGLVLRLLTRTSTTTVASGSKTAAIARKIEGLTDWARRDDWGPLTSLAIRREVEATCRDIGDRPS